MTEQAAQSAARVTCHRCGQRVAAAQDGGPADHHAGTWRCPGSGIRADELATKPTAGLIAWGLGLFLGGSSLSWLILLYGLGPEWPYGPLGWSIASAVVALVGLVPLCSGVKGMASKVDELYLRWGR